jgi:hypothetical protein
VKKKYKLKYISDFDNQDKPNEANLYAIYQSDDGIDNDELSKLISVYSSEYHDVLEWALLRLERMVKKRGIQLDQFENESEGGDLPIYKLKQTGTLRLYFIVTDPVTLIFGGSSEKFVRRWQDDSKLKAIVKSLCEMINQLDEDEIKITKKNCESFEFYIEY